MKKTTTLLLLLLIVGCAGITKLNGQSIAAETALNKADNTFFIENKGQWPEEVLYLTRIGGLDAWITKEGVVYDFYKIKEVKDEEQSKIPLLEELDPGMEKEKEMQRYGQVVKLQLQKSKTPALKPAQKQDGYYNYFLGNDERSWASYVGLYKEIRLENVYQNIDLKYYFDQGYLRYDYIVKPGGDPNEIKFELVGDDGHTIKQSGELVFDTRFGKIEQKELTLYQVVNGHKEEVNGEFVFDQKVNSFGFKIENYDKSKDLIIDPLVYSTFLGGNLNEAAIDVVVESDHAYIAGYTRSSNFPTTEGAYESENINYDYDVFVTKLSSDGSGLVYSTYVGGLQKDFIEGMVVESGHVYISGETECPDYPTTRKAYDESHNGNYDVFVTKLNSDGSGLVYSTFLGGTYTDKGEGIAVEDGHAYITGTTGINSNFPITPGAYDESCNEGGDAFVTKLTKDGDELVYSTFLGGAKTDRSRGIVVEFGCAYVTGNTYSSDFPTTEGAYDTEYNGVQDGFVTKLNSSGSDLSYSTFFGGNSRQDAEDIAVESGCAYVTGCTYGSDFPTTEGAYDQSFNGSTDIIVIKLESDGSGLIYSTYIGGSVHDFGWGIAVKTGHAYITGKTGSTDFPTTTGAYDESFNGSNDAYITKLNSDGSELGYSTYLGGWGSEGAVSIVVDSNDNVYAAGYTTNNDFPTTAGAYDESHNGGWDVFVTKMGIGATSNTAPIALCQDITINVDENCEGAVNIDNGSYDPDGDPITITFDPEGPYPVGDTEVTMTVSDGELEDQCIATVTVTEGDFTDDDCDGVPNACDVCPGGDDSYDENEDGVADCSQLLNYDEYSEDWYCGNNMIYIAHNLNNNPQTNCVNINSLSAHIGHGDWVGAYMACNMNPIILDIKKNDVTSSGLVSMTVHPNPFTDHATFTFTLTEKDNTTLKVYNTFGKEVATLFDGMAESGQQYTLNFSSGILSKGIYLYHLQSGNKVSVIKKMILMK